jgi:hypothetical protein
VTFTPPPNPMKGDGMKCSQTSCKTLVIGEFKTCDRCRARNREYHANLTSVEKKRRAKKVRNSFLKRKYGITQTDWDALFAAQGKRCGNLGCRATSPGVLNTGWHTDHDHLTGRFRSILCHDCNLALGAVQDSIAKLRGLMEYLQPSVMKII